jgi:hypothetical protein
LVGAALQLLLAVQPHLRECYDSASVAFVEAAAKHDPEAADALSSDREVLGHSSS